MDYEGSGVRSDKVDGKPIGKKQMAIEGYKTQGEMVVNSLDRLITAWEDGRESVVVEGVHSSLNFVVRATKNIILYPLHIILLFLPLRCFHLCREYSIFSFFSSQGIISS